MSMKMKDLTSVETMKSEEMHEVRGGLNAIIDNSQQANQTVVGGFGPITAVNSPVSAPSTVLTESNPYTAVNLNTTSLVGSHQNFLGSLKF